MGPFDRDILDFVSVQENESCSIKELFAFLSESYSYGGDRAEWDIRQLIKENLLVLDEQLGVISLGAKAKRSVVPLPPNSSK